MTYDMKVVEAAISSLHGYLFRQHWNGSCLSGPDSGVRFNSRIGRFVKSYLSSVPWPDRMTYLQAQGYWIQANWLLAHRGVADCQDIALQCTEFVLSRQTEEGFWEYPNPEWKGRIATVEGCYAALGLMATYRHFADERLLRSAERWYEFACSRIGFQQAGELLAINYFYKMTGPKVPNNSTLALKTFGNLYKITGQTKFRSTCTPMLRWLARVQLPTGELPYSLDSARARDHFLCYQYNAFEFLDLAEYYRITEDHEVLPIAKKLAVYLSQAITQTGSARYDCHHQQPEVLYYAAAVAAALSEATALGIGEYGELAVRAYDWVLSHQRSDGSFAFFSRNNYGVFADRRSYPRNLAMVLYHLLLWRERLSEHREITDRELAKVGFE